MPVVALKQGDFLEPLEEDHLIERNQWTLAKSDADLPGFITPTEQRGILIDIEKHVTPANVFTFHPDKYATNQRYHGLELPHHYHKEIGAMNAEKIKGAQLIAHDGRVECGVRNLEREQLRSFWIQTSTDKFYPDFLVKLTNGRVLAVEYKGGHFADTADTKKKERLGKLWELRSGGQCFFEMVKGPSELRKVQDALQRADTQ